MKKLIIFVCNGNIHRSVIAAESLKKMLKERGIGKEFSVDSYGLQGTMGTEIPKHKRLSEYPKEWKAAKPTLRQLDIDISQYTFQKVSAGIIKRANVVIAMDGRTYSRASNSLMKQFPDQAHKIHCFSELTLHNKSIKDPAGSGNKKVHQQIITNIYSTVNRKVGSILNWVR